MTRRTPEAAGRARLLVVDDDIHLLRTLSVAYEHAGLDVLVAEDGYQGQRLLLDAEPAPDALLCELSLPRGPDGVDLAVRRRGEQRLRGLPVWVATARVRVGSRAWHEAAYRAEDAGAELKPKPLPAELVARWAHAARGRRLALQRAVESALDAPLLPAQPAYLAAAGDWTVVQLAVTAAPAAEALARLAVAESCRRLASAGDGVAEQPAGPLLLLQGGQARAAELVALVRAVYEPAGVRLLATCVGAPSRAEARALATTLARASLA